MIKLTYILAASHSGSTLLAMMLNGHRAICTPGELKLTHLGDIQRYRCSCGSLIQACPFWEGIQQAMARRGFEFELDAAGTSYVRPSNRLARRVQRPLHRGALLESLRDATLALSPAWRRESVAIRERNSALMAAVLETAGAEMVVDSSKIALRLKHHLRNPDLDVRVIRLIRDGRGVALTYVDPAAFADARDPRLREGGCGGSREAERQSMDAAARQWRRSNEEAEHVLRHMDPARWIEVRYEALCQDPQAGMARILEFLELSPSDWRDDFRSAEHHVIGNGMRLDGSSEVRLDERWRTVLGPGELGVFDNIAGEMIRRYGYA